MSWDLHAQHICQCPCFSVVPEATHKASQGSETETSELLVGTEEKVIFPDEGMIIYKEETEIIELVARPDGGRTTDRWAESRRAMIRTRHHRRRQNWRLQNAMQKLNKKLYNKSYTKAE